MLSISFGNGFCDNDQQVLRNAIQLDILNCKKRIMFLKGGEKKEEEITNEERTSLN